MRTLCRSLRWKSYHGAEWETLEHLERHLAVHRGACTCVRTGQSWGPDGEIATPYSCTDARVCFKLSPKMPPPATPLSRLWQAARRAYRGNQEP